MQGSSRSDDRSVNEGRKHSHKNHSHKSKHREHSLASDKHGSHGELKQRDTLSTHSRLKVDKEPLKGENFASDRKGDPGILQFGSNHSYDIPPYRRTGYGHVLGLARSLKIDRAASTVKEIRFISSDPTGRVRNKHVFANVTHEQDQTVWPSEAISDGELDKNYLILEDKRQNSDDAEASDDSDSPDYRKGLKRVKDNEKDLEIRQKIAQVQASNILVDRTTWDYRVKSDPSDGEAWIELIKRQKVQSSGRQTRAERVSLANIKLSMYEKALRHVTGPLREELLRGMLEEAALVWDEEKLNKRWQDTLQKNRNSFGIHRDYINYHQTRGTRFRFDDLKTIYREALASASGTDSKRERQAIAQQKTREAGRHSIYLLLRYTISLRQAGYSEQAIAIWQATLERHFGRASVRHSEDELEKFWESEVPRIGEPDAQGVSHYIKHGGSAPVEKEDTPRADNDSRDIQAWLDDEERVEKLLPARMGDITDEEDAFRVVLFADIQPFLLSSFDVSDKNLLNAFLLFNGFPPLWQDEIKSWATDPFIYDSLFATDQDSSAEPDAGSKGRHRIFPLSSCQVTTDTLFASSNSPFDCFPSAGNRTTKSHTTLQWLRNVLRYVVDLNTGNSRFELLEYYLAFELKFFPQEVKKISKGYLKRHPQVLLLYNTYALIEYRLGVAESAKKVLSTAIQMRSGDPEIITLSRTLAWETLDSGEPSLALGYLLENAGNQVEMAIFERQRSLLSSMDKAVLDKQYLVPSYMDCLLLLGYLTNPNPLSAALSIFQSHLAFIASKLANHTGYTEGLHQSLARLVYHHMQHNPYKPSTVRMAIQQSMAAFPANTIFLSIFQINEQRFRINDRVRSVIRETLSREEDAAIAPPSPVITHTFAIQAEISRGMGLGSSLDSIRSAFERAIEDEATKNCPAIWRWYAEFELSQHNFSKEKGQHRSQRVIFRAVAACPWIRDFYLMAIRYLNGVQDVSGCKGVYSMMLERELRVRRSLDEGL